MERTTEVEEKNGRISFLYDSIGRIEKKLDDGMSRLNEKIDSLILTTTSDRVNHVKDTEGLQKRVQIVEFDSQNYKGIKNFFNGKFIDITLKVLIAGVLIFLGFKEPLAKVFGF